MAINIGIKAVSTKAAESATSTTHTSVLPSGLATGDIILMGVSYAGTTTTHDLTTGAVTGWTLIGTTVGVTGHQLTVYARALTATDNGHTITMTTSIALRVTMPFIILTGAEPNVAALVDRVTSNAGTTSASWTMPTSSATTRPETFEIAFAASSATNSPGAITFNKSGLTKQIQETNAGATGGLNVGAIATNITTDLPLGSTVGGSTVTTAATGAWAGFSFAINGIVLSTGSDSGEGTAGASGATAEIASVAVGGAGTGLASAAPTASASAAVSAAGTATSSASARPVGASAVSGAGASTTSASPRGVGAADDGGTGSASATASPRVARTGTTGGSGTAGAVAVGTSPPYFRFGYAQSIMLTPSYFRFGFAQSSLPVEELIWDGTNWVPWFDINKGYATGVGKATSSGVAANGSTAQASGTGNKTISIFMLIGATGSVSGAGTATATGAGQGAGIGTGTSVGVGSSVASGVPRAAVTVQAGGTGSLVSTGTFVPGFNAQASGEGTAEAISEITVVVSDIVSDGEGTAVVTGQASFGVVAQASGAGSTFGSGVAGSVPSPLPVLPDLCWPVDHSCCTNWDEYSEEVQARADAMAVSLMRSLSGYRVGGCPITVRPCRDRLGGIVFTPVTWGGAYPFSPLDWNGTWTNSGPCSGNCDPVCSLTLPNRVNRIVSIFVDGVEIGQNLYRVDNGTKLVWLGEGCGFPVGQDMTKPLTEVGTFAVTYAEGQPVDGLASYVAGVMACEFAKACTGNKCRLPAGVTSIARQGVSYTVSGGSFVNGLTGIQEVDAWLRIVNPKRAVMPVGIWSPDMPEGSTTTWQTD